MGAGPPLQGFLKRRETLGGNLLSGGNLHYYFTYPQSSLMRCTELFLSDSLGNHSPQRFSSKDHIDF